MTEKAEDKPEPITFRSRSEVTRKLVVELPETHNPFRAPLGLPTRPATEDDLVAVFEDDLGLFRRVCSRVVVTATKESGRR